jgi:catalase
MASRKPTAESKVRPQRSGARDVIGNGGEAHQLAGGTHPPLTTQTGAIISDDENSLKAGLEVRLSWKTTFS